MATSATQSVSIDVLSSDERKLITHALSVHRASVDRATRSGLSSTVPEIVRALEAERNRIDALSARFL